MLPLASPLMRRFSPASHAVRRVDILSKLDSPLCDLCAMLSPLSRHFPPASHAVRSMDILSKLNSPPLWPL
jgi:hypothetical protein